jgi:hypothetical protein
VARHAQALFLVPRQCRFEPRPQTLLLLLLRLRLLVVVLLLPVLLLLLLLPVLLLLLPVLLRRRRRRRQRRRPGRLGAAAFVPRAQHARPNVAAALARDDVARVRVLPRPRAARPRVVAGVAARRSVARKPTRGAEAGFRGALGG